MAFGTRVVLSGMRHMGLNAKYVKVPQRAVTLLDDAADLWRARAKRHDPGIRTLAAAAAAGRRQRRPRAAPRPRALHTVFYISRDESRSEIKCCNPKNQIRDHPEKKWKERWGVGG